MARRIIDLSVALQNDIASDPPGGRPRIDYLGHRQTLPRLAASFPGLSEADLPNGEAWAVEQIQISTHNGTHVDAPYHYGSTMKDGSPAKKIDELPLDWYFQPGVKLDFRHFPDGYVVMPADIDRELARIGHVLKPLEIVCVNTRAGTRYGEDDYVQTGCGMGRAATNHLTAKGIRVMGTDGWSWDAPFVYTARRWKESGDSSIIWEGHRAGLETGYCQIEKLANLETLPPDGFMVACFPFKIKAASAGWTRAVAILDD